MIFNLELIFLVLKTDAKTSWQNPKLRGSLKVFDPGLESSPTQCSHKDVWSESIWLIKYSGYRIKGQKL